MLYVLGCIFLSYLCIYRYMCTCILLTIYIHVHTHTTGPGGPMPPPHMMHMPPMPPHMHQQQQMQMPMPPPHMMRMGMGGMPPPPPPHNAPSFHPMGPFPFPPPPGAVFGFRNRLVLCYACIDGTLVCICNTPRPPTVHILSHLPLIPFWFVSCAAITITTPLLIIPF